MPKMTNVPEKLRAYIFHGVDVSVGNRGGGEESVGDCPFCGREGKFSVNVVNGMWRCFYCNIGGDHGKPIKGGNVYTFLRELHKQSVENDAKVSVISDCERLNREGYTALANDRGLMYESTLRRWGITRSLITGEWLVPGYNSEGKIVQLYRYVRSRNSRIMMETPCVNGGPGGIGGGGSSGLFGVNLFDRAKPDVYICEGFFDGCIWWEILGSTTPSGEPAVSQNISRLLTANVLAVPGCHVFLQQWASLLSGKKVRLMYDSDHPRIMCGNEQCKRSYSTVENKDGCPHCGSKEKKGKVIPPVGYEGMKLAVAVINKDEEPPSEIQYLKWSRTQGGSRKEEGYDATKPSGWDVRDVFKGYANIHQRISELVNLMGKFQPIPKDWIGGRGPEAVAKGLTRLDLLPCDNYRTLVNQWDEVMVWTDGLNKGMIFSLALSSAVMLMEDPLWGRMIGDPSSGKSSICEAVSTCRRYVFPISDFTGIISGFTRKDGKDAGLTDKIKGKLMVTKDGDTILSNPRRSQILSEMRDIFDTCSRKHYRTGEMKDKEMVRTGWLLCGTKALRELDASELGSRCIDCRVTDTMTAELERKINRRKFEQIRKYKGVESNGRADTFEIPERVKAKQLTGGYVKYLRENISSILENVEFSDDNGRLCGDLAMFTAFMRARPSSKQSEEDSRELSPRLMTQFSKLALCTAAVLNKDSVDDDVMRFIVAVATDTSLGRTWDIVKTLVRTDVVQDGGATDSTIVQFTSRRRMDVEDYMQFLRRIGVVEYRRVEQGNRSNKSGNLRWMLTGNVWDLFSFVGKLRKRLYPGDVQCR